MPEAETPGSDAARCDRRMNVAMVSERAGHAAVRFLESARIHRLPSSSMDYAASLRVLQAATGRRVPVHVRLEAPHSEVIVSVRSAG